MSWSFSIGRLFGSELRVHATFFLLLIWIAVAAFVAEGPAAALENVSFILALFACVVAHEFGHALMARRYGIKTPDITLLPIGGMARLERLPENPRQEIAVAVAGPAVNVVIWAVITVLHGVETRIDALEAIEDPEQGFFSRLATVNLFLVVFNMIPAFPMDGGRVLRAVLAMFMGRVTATQVAASAGQTIAFLFGVLGLLSGNPLLLLIAVFVFLAAAAESSDVDLKSRSRNVAARDAMITTFETLRPEDTIETAAMALVRTTQHEFPVLDVGGDLVGFLTKASIVIQMSQDRPTARVSDVMTTAIPSADLNAPLEEVLEGLQQRDVPAVAITDPRRAFLGYVTRENIGEWLILSKRG
ncbi:MAG: site-2 protease family protein [Paracoccaceae bacterium]|nr:site-2 protease family protein [Paracoccaceae bacterium]